MYPLPKPTNCSTAPRLSFCVAMHLLAGSRGGLVVQQSDSHIGSRSFRTASFRARHLVLGRNHVRGQQSRVRCFDIATLIPRSSQSLNNLPRPTTTLKEPSTANRRACGQSSQRSGSETRCRQSIGTPDCNVKENIEGLQKHEGSLGKIC